MTVYLRDLLERAVKTAAQAALGVVGAGAVGVLEVDWAATGSVAALAAVVSVLTSVASQGFGSPDSASLIDAASTGKHAK